MKLSFLLYNNYRFIQLVQLAGKPLKSTFYNLVTYVEVCFCFCFLLYKFFINNINSIINSIFIFVKKNQENQNKLQSKFDSYAQRNKILKETKIIPRVVYEIEQFNKEILLLGKRTGVSIKSKY